MNLKVLQWLLAHRDTLLLIVEAAKGWKKDLPHLQQWEIVDKIARLVIPMIDDEQVLARLLQDLDAEPMAALNDEVTSLNIDWKTLADIIIPIIISILQALTVRNIP